MSPINLTPQLRAAFDDFLHRWTQCSPSPLPRGDSDQRSEEAARNLAREARVEAQKVRFFDSPLELQSHVPRVHRKGEKDTAPSRPPRKLPDPMRTAAVPLFLKTLASPPGPSSLAFRNAFEAFWDASPLALYVLREAVEHSHRGLEFIPDVLIPTWLDTWSLPKATGLSVFLQAAFLHEKFGYRELALADDVLWLGGNTLYMGWMMNEIWICRSAAQIHLGENHRLHAADGPAVRFPNGDTLAYIDGIAVPSHIFHEDHRLTAEDVLSAGNQEVRRVYLERLGTERFLAQIAATEVAVDDFGILYKVPITGLGFVAEYTDEDTELRFVRVLNSTPEPGTSDQFKQYLLQVPPTIRTPREGIAWTFGLQSHEYSPREES